MKEISSLFEASYSVSSNGLYSCLTVASRPLQNTDKHFLVAGSSGYTPLHFAARAGQLGAVSLLLDAGRYLLKKIERTLLLLLSMLHLAPCGYYINTSRLLWRYIADKLYHTHGDVENRKA